MQYGKHGRPSKAKAAAPSTGKVAKLEGEVKSLKDFTQELLDQVAHNRKRAETHQIDWQDAHLKWRKAEHDAAAYRKYAEKKMYWLFVGGTLFGCVTTALAHGLLP